MSTSLRNFTSDNVEVGIDNILSLRFGDYLMERLNKNYDYRLKPGEPAAATA